MYHTIGVTDIELNINQSSVKIPIMMRYTLSSAKIRPFINTGIVCNWNLTKKINYIETYNYQNEIKEYNHDLGNKVNVWQFGYATGAGFELVLNDLNSLFAEVRYEKLHSLHNRNSIDLSSWSFNTGIFF